jgi:NAD(P)-dependent dehydrogenase (short-subunit alcohol dehydrogenase family)
MAAEWATSGIKVNVVSPGLLETQTLAALERSDARVAQEISASPLRRLVKLDEVASVVHFLCSEASDGIIGQTLVVDGGKRISAFVG